MTTTTSRTPAGVRRPAGADLADDRRREARRRRDLDARRGLGALRPGAPTSTPATPSDPTRDRFLLSKGHGPMAYYATLAAKGFFPVGWLEGWAVVRLAAGPPPRPRPRARRRDRLRARSATVCRWPSARRSACGRSGTRPRRRGPRRRRRARRGQQRTRRSRSRPPSALDEPHGGGGRQRLGQLRRRPGRIAQRFAIEGWAVATVDGRDHAALEPALRARSAGRPSVVVAEVARERAVTPRLQFAATATDLLDERPDRGAGLRRDLRAVLPRAVAAPPRPGRQRRHPRAAARQRRRRDGADRDAAGRAHLRLVPGRARPSSRSSSASPTRTSGACWSAVGGSFDVASAGRTHQSPGRRRAARHPARRAASTRPAPRPRSTTSCGGPSRGTGSALRARRRADQRRHLPRRRPASTSYGGGGARPWSRSARCSTRCSRPPPAAT